LNDTGETSRNRNRRPMDAATVGKRWWEANSAASPPEPSAPAVAAAAAAAPRTEQPFAAAAPPPPPPPALGDLSAALGAAERARIQQLEQELAAARDEASALHEMLEDLPEIFERKFRLRLHGILEQQQLLLSDNQALHERLHALQPAATDAEARPPLLLPAATAATPQPEQTGAAGPVQKDGAISRKPPLGSLLRGMLRLGRGLSPRRHFGKHRDHLSDPSDERPTAA
jgi:hypothetical protein